MSDKNCMTRIKQRPLVDVFESDNEFLVVTDLPGVTSENLSVDYMDNILRIDALREAGSAKKHDSNAVTYQRSFSIPGEVNTSGIEAELTHGVLHLHLPKHDRLKSRQINVKVG